MLLIRTVYKIHTSGQIYTIHYYTLYTLHIYYTIPPNTSLLISVQYRSASTTTGIRLSNTSIWPKKRA